MGPCPCWPAQASDVAQDGRCEWDGHDTACPLAALAAPASVHSLRAAPHRPSLRARAPLNLAEGAAAAAGLGGRQVNSEVGHRANWRRCAPRRQSWWPRAWRQRSVQARGGAEAAGAVPHQVLCNLDWQLNAAPRFHRSRLQVARRTRIAGPRASARSSKNGTGGAAAPAGSRRRRWRNLHAFFACPRRSEVQVVCVPRTNQSSCANSQHCVWQTEDSLLELRGERARRTAGPCCATPAQPATNCDPLTLATCRR